MIIPRLYYDHNFRKRVNKLFFERFEEVSYEKETNPNKCLRKLIPIDYLLVIAEQEGITTYYDITRRIEKRKEQTLILNSLEKEITWDIYSLIKKKKHYQNDNKMILNDYIRAIDVLADNYYENSLTKKIDLEELLIIEPLIEEIETMDDITEIYDYNQELKIIPINNNIII